jgi:hypothetical protein
MANIKKTPLPADAVRKRGLSKFCQFNGGDEVVEPLVALEDTWAPAADSAHNALG